MSEGRKMTSVDEVLSQLTLEEKVYLLHGDMMSGGVARLGIGQLVCADGPVGIRVVSDFPGGILPTGDGEVQNDNLAQAAFAPTAYSSTIGLAATFDVDLARDFGGAIGCEAKAAGIRVMFGPGVNLMRDPRCGRNFEYMGEDPFLTGAMGAAYIKGMQAQGVGACAKHYYANDLEFRRHFTNSNLDERTKWEMHLSPFVQACCEAGVWVVMTGNNLVNGMHISENEAELKGILRERLGWDGVVLTDWRAAYGPAESIEGGTTMTTGFCSYVYGDGRLLKMVRSGEVREADIDERVRDVLRLYERVGLLDEANDKPVMFDIEGHREKARVFARESMVLLKNEGDVLPLVPDKVGKIVVTGQGADVIAVGSGSSKVTMKESAVSPATGLVGAYGKGVVVCEADVERAIELAGDAGAVIYFAVGPTCGEGFDLEGTRLSDEQEQEILRLSEVCGERLVVVLQCGTAVDVTRWKDGPAGILVAWLGGEAMGSAVADIICGAVSPSGKLPCTFGNGIEDYPCARLGLWPAELLLDEDPGKPGFKPEERFVLRAYDANYAEGVFVGYRWFMREGIEVVYPFGYGLAYTKFEVSGLKVEEDGEGYVVRCMVKNVGDKEGAEVVQVYVAPVGSEIERPTRELKGFGKVLVAVGEEKNVTVRLKEDAFAYYDDAAGGFKVAKGEYKVQVGKSCQEILLEVVVEVEEERVVKTSGNR